MLMTIHIWLWSDVYYKLTIEKVNLKFENINNLAN